MGTNIKNSLSSHKDSLSSHVPFISDAKDLVPK